MARPRQDLMGQTFGRLLVTGVSHVDGGGTYWKVMCECGTEKSVRYDALLRGTTRSCGCFASEDSSRRNATHRMTDTSIYAIWYSMKARCQSPKSPAYMNYGGRGISVDPSWMSFEKFFLDMGDRPFPGAQLDRIDNDGNYCKENCRWSTSKENCRHTRGNHLIEFEGVKVPMVVASERSGVPYARLWARMNSGWPTELLYIPKVR